MNTLYYGDNLDIMRRYIKDESVDLSYLDPLSIRMPRITCSFRIAVAARRQRSCRHSRIPGVGRRLRRYIRY